MPPTGSHRLRHDLGCKRCGALRGLPVHSRRPHHHSPHHEGHLLACIVQDVYGKQGCLAKGTLSFNVISIRSSIPFAFQVLFCLLVIVGVGLVVQPEFIFGSPEVAHLSNETIQAFENNATASEAMPKVSSGGYIIGVFAAYTGKYFVISYVATLISFQQSLKPV